MAENNKQTKHTLGEIEDLSIRAIANLESNQLDQAIVLFDAILKEDPEHESSLWHRSVALNERGDLNYALTDLHVLLKKQPENIKVHNQIRIINRKLIGSWHFDMMNDAIRNNAYLKAIENAVTEDTVVFEIGAGSGLLSMMAARAGAKFVYSCEKELPTRLAAQAIIDINGLSDKIKLIDQWSTAVLIPEDLPEKVDLVVAEIFGPALLDEECLHFFQDIKKRILKPGGKIIPEGATMFCALLESDEILNRVVVNTVCGFDLSHFNSVHEDPSVQLLLKDHKHRLLSQQAIIKSFDFLSDEPIEAIGEIAIPVTQSGTCHGVVQWFRLDTDENNSIDTSPFCQRTHWDQHFQMYQKPFVVTEGETVRFTVRQFNDRFSLEPIVT